MHALSTSRSRFAHAVAAVVIALAPPASAAIQVASNADSGANTLRAAITAANGTVGSDTITFAIGTGAGC